MKSRLARLWKFNWSSPLSLLTTILVAILILLIAIVTIVFLAPGGPLGPEVQIVPTLTSAQNEEYSVDVYYPRNVPVPLVGPPTYAKISVCIRERVANVSARVSEFALAVTAPEGSRFQEVGEFLREKTHPDIWVAELSIRHSGRIEEFNETLVVHIVYKVSSQNSTTIKEINAPLFVDVVMEDCSGLLYLGILVFGVFASYVTSAEITKGVTTTTTTTVDKKTALRVLLWLGFSALVGILAFGQFRKQVTLTTEPLLNFALAFAFGFASEKLLSVKRQV
jgi:hypothetical protein